MYHQLALCLPFPLLSLSVIFHVFNKYQSGTLLCAKNYICGSIVTRYCCVSLITFSRSSVSKETASNAGDPGLIPGSGRSPGEENGNLLQHSCLEKSHGQRSLADYSP